MKNVTKELPVVEPEPVTEQFGEKTQELFNTNRLPAASEQEWGRWSRPAPGAVSRRKVPLWRYTWNEIRRNPGRFCTLLLVAAAAGVWTYNVYSPHLFEIQSPSISTERVTVSVSAAPTSRATTRPLHQGNPRPLRPAHPKTKTTTVPAATPNPVHSHTPTPGPTVSKTPSSPPADSTTPSPDPTTKGPVTTKSAPEPCTSTSGSPCS